MSCLGLARADVEAEAVPVFVYKLEVYVRELDSPELPAVEDDNAAGLLALLYLEPGTPGLVGSSRLPGPGFFDSITTTRLIVGRNWGSPCVHNNPIWIHIAIWSPESDAAKLGSTISKLLSFL